MTRKKKKYPPSKEETIDTHLGRYILSHFFTVADIKRSADFYLRVLGGKVVRSGEPIIIQIANSWIVLNLGGEDLQTTSQL